MRITATETVSELLAIDSSDHLEAWLKRVVGANVLNDEQYWRNVGDQSSNAGPIEASADEINPLVERIVNGMEAIIELRVAESGEKPPNPRAAIEALFDIPRGESRLLDERAARELGRHLAVSLRGQSLRTDPTIEVRDRGLGIHPDDFSGTILALGQSDKGQKPYLIGMYGQGGSSTFDKCEYTIIVSRRHPDHLTGGQSDQVGWTVVRRRLNVRAPVYSYLVDPGTRTRSVPSFSGLIGDQVELNHGTLVAHVGYRGLGGFAKQKITNNAFYTLNYRLFDPLLPWVLIGDRPGDREVRTMRGIPYRVRRFPEVTGIGSMEARQRREATAVRHHSEYRHGLPSDSELRVEWWILQDEQVQDGRRRRDHTRPLRPYRDQTRRYARRVVVITRGGQTHAALTTNQTFVKKRLRQLARSIIVQVDTDDMTWEEGASFFASNRADMKTKSRDLVEEAINAAIDLHLDELRAIERERQAELVAGRAASDEDTIRQHLDPMIRAFQRSRTTPGTSTDRSRRRGPPFRGHQVPNFLRFARTRPLQVRPGVPTRVELLTDAADDVVKDSRTEFRVQSNNEGLEVGEVQGGSGRWRVALFPSADLAVGTRIEITASIAKSNAWRLETEQPGQVVVEAPPPPYEGNDPPTIFRFRSQNGTIHVRQGGARIRIESNARNELVRNGADLKIDSPDSDTLPIKGWSGPREGIFRVNLSVPDDAPLGPAGEIMASLKLPDGSELDDTAELVIDQRLNSGGSADVQPQPNYDIRDVQEVPVEDDVSSWSEMPTILEGSDPWTGGDVGAYLETGDEGQRKITFYLNADNRELRNVERRIARRHSEAAVDLFREMHRTLLCFHLYRLATSEASQAENDYAYRGEMIRVGQTLLYTHREFLEQISDDGSEQ